MPRNSVNDPTKQSSSANQTSFVRNYSSIGCEKEGWITLQSGPTSPPSMDDPGQEKSFCLPGDSLAKIYQSPAKEPALMENDPDCGASILGSFARFDQRDSLLKMFQASLWEGDSTEWHGTWPAHGMIFHGQLSEHLIPHSLHPIGGAAFGSVGETLISAEEASLKFPTPRVCDTEGGPSGGVELNKGSFSRTNKAGVRWGVKLKDAIQFLKQEEKETFLTPRANEPCENPESFVKRMRDRGDHRGDHCHGSLSSQVKYPTPLAGDAHLSSTPEAAKRRIAEGKPTLSRVVQSKEKIPTPTASERSGSNTKTGQPGGLTGYITQSKMLPTPRAGKTTSENQETWEKRKKEGKVSTPPLGLAVKMKMPDLPLFPTPTVSGNYNKKGSGPKSGDGLETAVKKMFPTPRSSEIAAGMNMKDVGNRIKKTGYKSNLEEAVARWPTPRASDQHPACKGRVERIKEGESPHSFQLREAVQADQKFPTPQARDHKGKSGRAAKGEANDLPNQIEKFPTPQASDHRDRGNLGMPSIQRRQEMGKQLNLGMVVDPTSGALSADWVSLLMGYPLNWTLVTPALGGNAESPGLRRGKSSESKG